MNELISKVIVKSKTGTINVYFGVEQVTMNVEAEDGRIEIYYGLNASKYASFKSQKVEYVKINGEVFQTNCK